MSSTTEPLAPSSAPNQPSTAELIARVEALTKLVDSRTPTGNKRKRSAPDENDDSSADARRSSYRGYGRNLARRVGVFDRIHTIVEHGVNKALADSDDEAGEETTVEKNLTESWARIKSTIPGFGEDMIALAGQRKLRKQICSEVQEGVRGARGDDTNSLKGPIGEYIQPIVVLSDSGDPLPTPVIKFSASGTKANRGFVNPHTARLNTPVKFPATEETYAAIRNGDIAVLGTDMPYLMYRDGYVFNPDDREDGLLEGSTLFATAKHIYQGPSTALKPDGCARGRAGNASINGITALTDRDVGYIAIQARFGVSSQDHWNQMDVDFNYRDFYWSVVDMLQGEEGQEILDRFNMKVFGTKSSAKKATPATTTGPTDFDILAAQRAAKRARKIAAAAESSASASN